MSYVALHKRKHRVALITNNLSANSASAFTPPPSRRFVDNWRREPVELVLKASTTIANS